MIRLWIFLLLSFTNVLWAQDPCNGLNEYQEYLTRGQSFEGIDSFEQARKNYNSAAMIAKQAECDSLYKIARLNSEDAVIKQRKYLEGLIRELEEAQDSLSKLFNSLSLLTDSLECERIRQEYDGYALQREQTRIKALLQLSTARHLAQRSIDIQDDSPLKGKLAIAAYWLHQLNKDSLHEPIFYKAMYQAAGRFDSTLRLKQIRSQHSRGIVGLEVAGDSLISLDEGGFPKGFQATSIQLLDSCIRNKLCHNLLHLPNQGWLIGSREGGHFFHFSEKKNSAQKPISADIRCLAASKAEIWMGTSSGKIIHLQWKDQKPAKWELVDTVKVDTVMVPILDLAFEPFTRQLFILDGNGKGWAFQEKRPSDFLELLDLKGKQATQICLHPSDSLLAIGTQSGEVLLWNWKQKRLSDSLLGHTAPITSLEFSPDGSRLASGSYDQSVRVWQTQKPKQSPIVLDDHDGQWISALAFASDHKLWVGCRNGLVKGWWLKIEELQEALKQALIQKNLKLVFDPTEWEKQVGKEIPYHEDYAALQNETN